ncbi:hypothetical protein SZMC14600_05157 [Saccharomonospora azurea SZMC 14600]|nr:hypothetical protein SZMC14600_05157 [Saccharomonospora azurea SZMC 14600]
MPDISHDSTHAPQRNDTSNGRIPGTDPVSGVSTSADHVAFATAFRGQNAVTTPQSARETRVRAPLLRGLEVG